ncbi:MAG TPA: hypothetical protein VFV43_03075, partial [Limnobacter sp.]|nr:hypothetical protein [Limnobacter sp.]
IHAAQVSAADLPNTWTLLEIRCPIGCFETTVDQFRSQLGQTINLGAAHGQSSPIGACAFGKLHLALEEASPKDVIKGMNETLPPEAIDANGRPLQFSQSNTGIGYSPFGEAQDRIKTGILECRDPQWQGKWEQRKRILSIDERRMVTLEEDGALAIYYHLPKP